MCEEPGVGKEVDQANPGGGGKKREPYITELALTAVCKVHPGTRKSGISWKEPSGGPQR